MIDDRRGIFAAIAAKSYSKCQNEKTGCFIQLGNGNVTFGSNGPKFKKCIDLKDNEGCPRIMSSYFSDRKLCNSTHCTMDALNHIKEMNEDSKGMIVYRDGGIPCADCLSALINAGMKELVTTNTLYHDGLSKILLGDWIDNHGGIHRRIDVPPRVLG